MNLNLIHLNNEEDTEDYDRVRMDHSSRKGRVVRHIRKSLFYNYSSIFRSNNESVFIDIQSQHW